MNVGLTIGRSSHYGVAEHLVAPEEMSAYLQGCITGANVEALSIANGRGQISCSVRGPYRIPKAHVILRNASTRLYLERATRA